MQLPHLPAPLGGIGLPDLPTQRAQLCSTLHNVYLLLDQICHGHAIGSSLSWYSTCAVAQHTATRFPRGP
eukprot:3877720-Amphidinium_carterae.1